MLHTPENTPKAEVYCNGHKIEGLIMWVDTDKGVAEITMSYINTRIPINHWLDEYSNESPVHTYLLYGKFEVIIPKC